MIYYEDVRVKAMHAPSAANHKLILNCKQEITMMDHYGIFG